MTSETQQTARRSFMSRFGMGAALVAGVGAGLAAARPAVAQTNSFKPRRHPEDAWMDTSNVAHRVVIDSAFPPGGGAALLYANNNFLANKTGYGLDAQDIAIIVVFRHLSTPFAFSDAIWAKHGETLSEIIDFKNPATNAVPLANLYNSGGAGMSLPNRGVTIASLVEKNVQFAVCGSAMRFMANAIAQRTKGEADAVYKEFAGNLVPNSHIAPAGVVAVNRAQEYGYTLLTAV
jgi:intracellular sulfur oxidation DsrE/DsrF family protein